MPNKITRICYCCRYSTESLPAMKAHMKTLKHRHNKQHCKDNNIDPSKDFENIIQENEKRRSESGDVDKYLRGLGLID